MPAEPFFTKITSPDELHWQAFCYVTGEMEVRQAGEFEALLETDQTAREALAAALETLQLVTAAESLHPVLQPHLFQSVRDEGARVKTWRRGLAWMSLGAAAAMLLAVSLPRFWPVTDAEDWRSAGLTPELAVAWSQMELSQPDLGLLVPADVPSSQRDESDDVDDVWHVDSRHAAPAWMMAAVRGLAQDKSPEPAPAAPATPAAPIEMEN
jgi:hypothetical protein